MNRKYLLLFALLIMFCSTMNTFGKIGIIVNKDLYSLIKTSVDNFIKDVEKIEKKSVWLEKDKFSDRSSVRELKNALVAQYKDNQLEGAILIGDLPIARYKIKSDVFACDLYYMDMNGNWSGSGSTFTNHTGSTKGEIWLSRITASVLERYSSSFGKEVDIVNKYFKRVRDRMTGKDPMKSKYVIAGQYWEWKGLETENTGDLNYASSSIDKYRSTRKSNDKACGRSWLNAIKEGREYGFIYSHSSPTSHAVGVNLRTLRNEDLNCRFYNSYACSNADFEKSNMSGAYALSDKGLVCVGSAKTGSMKPGTFRAYNRPLGAGKNFGEAFLDWYNEKGIKDKYWHYGMTLQGVGTLHLKPYNAVSIKIPNAKNTEPFAITIVGSKLIYSVPAVQGKDASAISIGIYNMKGILITELVNEAKEAGTYNVKLSTAEFTRGVYLFNYACNGRKETARFIVK